MGIDDGHDRPPHPTAARPAGTDRRASRAAPASAGGMREAVRLVAAGRTAIARTLGQSLEGVLDEPLPDELARLIARLGTGGARPR